MIAVRGLSAWSPGFSDLARLRADEPDPEHTDPPLDVPNRRSWRGTSRVTRMLARVVHETTRLAEIDVARVPIVYASAWGEIDIMVHLLGQIADGETGLSPLRFKHSVHNAASGAVSIAAGNRELTTAIAAGLRTFEYGLLEALAVLQTGPHDDVVLAVGEDVLPEPLDRFAEYRALAVGMALSRRPGAATSGAIGWPQRRSEPGQLSAVPEPLRGNPTAWALPLVDALLSGSGGEVALSGAQRPYGVAVEAGGGA